MPDPCYLGAYWGPRPAAGEECAERLVTCLDRLRGCAPILTTWFRKGRSPSASRDPVTAATVSELVRASHNRRDTDGSPVPELGFSVGLWNGQTETPVGLRMSCGVSALASGIMNSFVLDLPAPEGPALALYEPAVARGILAAVVGTWQPDWATLTSLDLHDAVAPSPRQPVTGWLTYLAAEGRGSVPQDVGACVEPLVDGTLIVAADTLDAVEGAALRKLATRLDRAGALTPTP